MVKKSIIAIALICMLATVSYCSTTNDQGAYPINDTTNQGQAPGQFKVDGKWPVTCTYTPVEICKIKVVLEVGMFIEIDNCSNKKIVLKQVQCPTGATPNQTFPCYKGCTDIKVRSNFEALLALKLYNTGTVINDNDNDPAQNLNPNDDKWKAYFADDANGTNPHDTQVSPVSGNWNTYYVCVEAWDANIYSVAPASGNAAPVVGQVAVTAVPTAVIVCN